MALEGGFGLLLGTSGSAPIVASFIAAVNDARLAVGKKPVGWINPAVRRYTDTYYKCLYGTERSFILIHSPTCITTSLKDPTRVARRTDSPLRLAGTPSLGWARQTSRRCWLLSWHCLEKGSQADGLQTDATPLMETSSDSGNLCESSVA